MEELREINRKLCLEKAELCERFNAEKRSWEERLKALEEEIETLKNVIGSVSSKKDERKHEIIETPQEKKTKKSAMKSVATESLAGDGARSTKTSKRRKRPAKKKVKQELEIWEGPPPAFLLQSIPKAPKRASRRWQRSSEQCGEEGCTKKNTYGFFGEAPTRCRDHKILGMVDVCNPLCQGDECFKHPTFGKPGTSRGLYCKKHCPPEMHLVNVTKPQCKFPGCLSNASFGYADEIGKNGKKRQHVLQYCRAHKQDGMQNLLAKICEVEGCEGQASFAFPSAPKPLRRCSKHALVGMENLAKARCKMTDGCRTFPTFGFTGQAAVSCRAHALPTMENVRQQKCEYAGCKKECSWGYAGTNKMLVCSQHRLNGMLELRSKRCAVEDCPKRPSFNWIGLRPKYCKGHSEEGMVDLKRRMCEKEDCHKHAVYGYQGEDGRFCAAHKLPGMRNRKLRRCATEGCAMKPQYAFRGESKATVCKAHSTKEMVSVCFRRATVGQSGTEAQRRGLKPIPAVNKQDSPKFQAAAQQQRLAEDRITSISVPIIKDPPQLALPRPNVPSIPRCNISRIESESTPTCSIQTEDLENPKSLDNVCNPVPHVALQINQINYQQKNTNTTC